MPLVVAAGGGGHSAAAPASAGGGWDAAVMGRGFQDPQAPGNGLSAPEGKGPGEKERLHAYTTNIINAARGESYRHID